MLNDAFSTTFQFVNPYADVSFTPKSNSLIRLSYALGHQVPDIGALNPYRNTDTPNEVSYGNPNLKAQTDNSISLSGNFRIGKFNLFASSTHTFTNNIILTHNFLEGNLLHSTQDNIGKRYENQTKVNLSSKITRTTWVQLEANLYHTDYAKKMTFTNGIEVADSPLVAILNKNYPASSISAPEAVTTVHTFICKGKAVRTTIIICR